MTQKAPRTTAEEVVDMGSNGLPLNVEDDTNNGIIYRGVSQIIGAADDAAVWQIEKILYTNVLGVKTTKVARFADGERDQFNKVWDDRAGYTYS